MGLWASASRRVRGDERGAGYLAAFLVLLPVVLLLAVGILVDSARYFAVWRQCNAVALEAARAGANAIEADLVRVGETVIDAVRAQSSAHDAAGGFVAAANDSPCALQSVAVNGDRVSVAIAGQVASWFQVIDARTVTGRATASANRIDIGG